MNPEATTGISAARSSVSSLGRASVALSRMRRFGAQAFSTTKYLMQTEVHTFAFSVAANGILSFFPFIVLMLTLTRDVFHSAAMYTVVIQLLRDYLPAGQEFVIRNLTATVAAHRSMKIASLAILLITSTGVFLPLEVALNRVWKIERNRSYLGNQIIAIALAFGCGALALFSVALTAGNQLLLQAVFGESRNIVLRALAYTIMKIFAVFASIAIFFLIYWILPNGKIKTSSVLPAAVATGILWELGKYAYIRALPWLDFEQMYGPFAISVTLMFWAFLSGLLLLAGAHLSADASGVAP